MVICIYICIDELIEAMYLQKGKQALFMVVPKDQVVVIEVIVLALKLLHLWLSLKTYSLAQ